MVLLWQIHMCLAIPGKVIKIEGRKAMVKYPSETRPAMVAQEQVAVGDIVLVQMGLIVSVIKPGSKSQAGKRG